MSKDEHEYVMQVWEKGEDPRGLFKVKPLTQVSDHPWEAVLIERNSRVRLHVFRQLTSDAPVFQSRVFAPHELREWLFLDEKDQLAHYDRLDDIVAAATTMEFTTGLNYTIRDLTGQLRELKQQRALSIQFLLDFRTHNDHERRKYKERLKRAANKWLESKRTGPKPKPVDPNRALARQQRPDPLLALRTRSG